jgi:transcriptional regulator with XRE-family HTH domain
MPKTSIAIKAARERAKMSVAELAEKLGMSSEEDLSAFEDGSRPPTEDMLKAIADATKADFADLVAKLKEDEKTDAFRCGKKKKRRQEYNEDFTELTNVEIFATGLHNGKLFTKADLDQIVANQEKYGDELKPPLVLGHDEKQPILQNSGLPAGGWLSHVQRQGEKLFADFGEVARLLAEAVKLGRYKRISVELYDDYKGQGLALRRIGILGADVPAVKNLKDVVALDDSGCSYTTYFSEATPQGKETDAMTQEELKKMQDAHEAEMKALKDQNEAQAKALTDQKKAFEEQKALFEEQKKALDEQKSITTKLSETLVKREKERRSAELRAFAQEQAKAGRILPRHIDGGIVAFMEALDAKTVLKFSEGNEKSPLDYFKSFVAELPTIEKFRAEAAADVLLRTDGLKDGEFSEGSTRVHAMAEKLIKEDPRLKDMPYAEAYAEAVEALAKENSAILDL